MEEIVGEGRQQGARGSSIVLLPLHLYGADQLRNNEEIFQGVKFIEDSVGVQGETGGMSALSI